MRLLDVGDSQTGKLTTAQGQELINEAMKIFRWYGAVSASRKDHEFLKTEHPILADIACFQSAHINHLIPRTLDITAAQEKMKQGGLRVKDRIEGPPPRACPILLRQTSFLAIEEPVKFPPESNKEKTQVDQCTHKARFAVIEERGAAVTEVGRQLYDELFSESMASEAERLEPSSPGAYNELVERVFKKYPDDWAELRRRGLIYCTFRCTEKRKNALPAGSSRSLESLLRNGLIEAFPIIYEDFLPLPAVGIFQSNLNAESLPNVKSEPDPQGMEVALGVPLMDPDTLYKRLQSKSIAQCADFLRVEIKVTS